MIDYILQGVYLVTQVIGVYLIGDMLLIAPVMLNVTNVLGFYLGYAHDMPSMMIGSTIFFCIQTRTFFVWRAKGLKWLTRPNSI